MSSRFRFDNQGVYVKEKPDCSSAKTKLAALKCMALLLGCMAIPTSPIAPDLASGVILKKGTAVSKVFEMQFPLLSTTQFLRGSNCALETKGKTKRNKRKKFITLLFIYTCLKKNWRNITK